jgi:hypothetical protein
MASYIDLAADHGIDGFIFDYYWYEGAPFLDRALDRGFLGAPNSRRLEFSLMWANHDWMNLFPSHSPIDPDPILMPGRTSREQFEALANHVIENYFSRPNYALRAGRPRFSIYEIGHLITSLGGLDGLVDALRWFDDRTRAAGFPGLHLDVIVWSFELLPSDIDIIEPSDLLSRLDARSASSYVWIHHVDMSEQGKAPARWSDVGRQAFDAYESYRRDLPVPFIPNVTVGWDPSPRCKLDVPHKVGHYPWTPVWAPDPAAFRQGLERAQEFVGGMDPGDREVTINAWNEWTEGSYLLPDELHEMAYLRSIKDVFGVAELAEEQLLREGDNQQGGDREDDR